MPSLSREEGWVILVTGPLPVVRHVSVIAALRVSGAGSGQGIPPPHAAQRRNLWQQIVKAHSMFPPCVSQLVISHLFPPSNTKTSMTITTSKQLQFASNQKCYKNFKTKFNCFYFGFKVFNVEAGGWKINYPQENF